MSLIQQYKIELSKAKKELTELQIEIRTYLSKIADCTNPFNSSDIENIKMDEIKIFCKNLEIARDKAIEVNKKIKNIESELE